jgi:peptide chain release factor 3
MTPVFFGSALNNFGVQELLEQFTAVAPEPLARESDVRIVLPEEETFSGLVFKIHANLDPRHRDRIAYMRICSGVFERNKTYFHVRSGKPFRTSNPTAFMAQERTIVDQAFPGDIIGIHDTGTLRIGDTITEGEELQFVGVPHFAPQIFRKILNKDPLKSKQLDKGLDQLSEEGVVQIFRPINGTDRIIGVVGALQLDVVKFRLEHEYRALCDYEALNYTTAAWVSSKTKSAMDELVRKYSHRMARDPEGNYVYLAENPWLLQRRREEEPEVEFRFTSGV